MNLPRTLTLTAPERAGEKIHDLDNPNERLRPRGLNFVDPAHLAAAPEPIRDAHSAALAAYTAWRAKARALGDAYEAWERAPAEQAHADREALRAGSPMPKSDLVVKTREELTRADRAERAAHAHALELYEAYRALLLSMQIEWHAAQFEAAEKAQESIRAELEQLAVRIVEMNSLASVANALHQFEGRELEFEATHRHGRQLEKIRKDMAKEPMGRGRAVENEVGALLGALAREHTSVLLPGPPARVQARAARDERRKQNEEKAAKHAEFERAARKAAW
ncbi:hypothetical protein GKE82_03690 [Conexibacter sp. W3-3-2]|uniref:hypothetical protein n=1 Tax=Conexibacter sp. W3-3-2 TaxID=2675227 RepID=UPI0012B90E64|nr:hypothetical protein [Conexibacter sp. W3-3-2]MTD43427.1 hypothetical protein [Conexibacter sp. W3-3-2]